jgi:hypothetical protein
MSGKGVLFRYGHDARRFGVGDRELYQSPLIRFAFPSISRLLPAPPVRSTRFGTNLRNIRKQMSSSGNAALRALKDFVYQESTWLRPA